MSVLSITVWDIISGPVVTGTITRHTVDSAVKTKLVIGSDGLWDMLTEQELGHIEMCPSLTASALVAFCANRWRQEWRYQWAGQCV